MRVRPASFPDDAAAVAAIIIPVIRAGETYALDRDLTEADALAVWFAPDREVFVAEDDDGAVVGTFFLRPNRPGGGSHVANCGFMTAAHATGRGVARRMFEHALERARERGFRAIQYNFVVSANERAVKLWKSVGFDVVGRLPGAFAHPTLGFVDVLVMFRAI